MQDSWDDFAVADVLAAADQHIHRHGGPLVGVGHSFGGASLVKVTKGHGMECKLVYIWGRKLMSSKYEKIICYS